MSNTKTVMGQASNQYVAPLNVEDVFSTYLWAGNDATQTINNGVDLTEGGLTWIKNRTLSNKPHFILDTERGGGKYLSSDTSYEERDTTGYANSFSFNSNGFSFTSASDYTNISGSDYASWTFRKAPKFFTCVTWTGDGTSNRAIPHDLGGAVGSYFVKCTSDAFAWIVWHKDSGANNFNLVLNTTAAVTNFNLFSTTAPDSSNVYLGTSNLDYVNATGRTYVAYIFAHNDGDGGFGPNGDADIIKCGSYTGTGAEVDVDLGFEPQWILTRRADDPDDWYMVDTMRGVVTAGDDAYLRANLASAEGTGVDIFDVTATGFKTKVSSRHTNGGNYIYIAIRRGTKVPESGTEVFSPNLASGYPRYPSGFATDFVIQKSRSSGSGSAYSRLQGNNNLDPSTTAQESASAWDWAQMTGSGTNFTSTNYIGWNWKRAPGYFDVVAYTGNGTAGLTVSHNLGVAPEMIWVKRRDAAVSWPVYHKQTGSSKRLFLNSDSTEDPDTTTWNAVDPTATDFTLGTYTGVNASSGNYIAYLFASLPGISKVGSFSHTSGTATNVDCGFTAGARFVLIKQLRDSRNWYVFDTERGIVAGNDKALFLNTTGAEQTFDWLTPSSAGFTVNGGGVWDTDNFIFYAIA